MGFRGDVTVFRRDATADGQSGLTAAFRRNTAERVYTIEAAHAEGGSVIGDVRPWAVEIGTFSRLLVVRRGDERKIE
jgi:hypothetical protein